MLLLPFHIVYLFCLLFCPCVDAVFASLPNQFFKQVIDWLALERLLPMAYGINIKSFHYLRFLQYTFCCVIFTPATGLCFLVFIKKSALQAGSLTLQETYRQQIFARFWIVFYYKLYKVLLPCRKNTRQRWYVSLANILQEDTEVLK